MGRSLQSLGEGAVLEAWVLGGGGHDGGAADEGAGVGWDVGEIIGGVVALGERVNQRGKCDSTLKRKERSSGEASKTARPMIAWAATPWL